MKRAAARAGRQARQRGAFAVEAALVLPILLGVGLLGADIQRIHTERIRLENTAGTLAVNLAAQRELTGAGLDALAKVAMQGHEADQQIYVLNVQVDGSVSWGLIRGGAENLCEAPAVGGIYEGTLPDDSRRDDTTAAPGMVMVRSCRRTDEVALFSGLGIPDVLKTDAIFPSSHRTIKLDTELQGESDANGLAAGASDT